MARDFSCERVTCDFFQAGHIVRGSASAAIPRSTCSLLGARVLPGAVGFSVPSAICFTPPRPCAFLRLLMLSSASCVASSPLLRSPCLRIGDLASAISHPPRLGWVQISDDTGAAVSSIGHADGSVCFLHIDSYQGDHHGHIGPWHFSTWNSQAAVKSSVQLSWVM